MPKISIIIPVYNVEEYLETCIESILQQKFTDYEIILVNDGSQDISGNICDLYSKKYNFITAIHKKNGGLSDARNTGLQYAKGEYILFIDSDDYISKGSLSAISKTMAENVNVEVVFLEAIKVFPDGSTIPLGDGYQKKDIINKTQEEVLAHIASLSKFPGSACTKLIKKSLILENNLYFKKGQLSEDIDWTVRLLLTAQTFNYCSNYHYYYRQARKGSITNTANINNLYSLLNIVKQWSKKPYKRSSFNIFQKYINAFMAYEYIIILLLYGNLAPVDKKRLKADVRSYSWLLTANTTKKVRVINIFYKVLGFKVTTTILSIYHKLRYMNRCS